MIDYKIRNRANRVVLKGQWGGNFTRGQKTAAARGLWGKDAYYDKNSNQYVYFDGDGKEYRIAADSSAAPNVGEFLNNRNPFFSAGRKEFNTQQGYAKGTGKEWRHMDAQERANYNLAANTEGLDYTHKVDENNQNVSFFTKDGQTISADSEEFANLQGQANDLKKEQLGTTQNMVGQVANAALGVANQVIDSSSKIDQQSSFGSAFQSGWDSASDLVGKINPMWGAIAKGAGTVMKAVDNIFATDSDSYSVDDRLVADLGGSYGGAVSQMEDAASRAGKYGGLFSNGARRRANKAISKAKHNQSILNDINQVSRQQQDLVNQMGDQSSNAYQFDLTGGYKQQYMRAAKEGGVIEERFVPVLVDDMIVPKRVTPGEFMNGGVLKEVINPESGGIVEWEPELVDWAPILVDSFKPGGKIEKALDAPETEETEQKSVIPEGSLHKDKHHMENTEGMTKKGIPVVDDDSKQQAEIERNEIIFTKEVTKKLEELYKVYYDDNSSAKEKDEAAIDAGKLLTKEIMLNTDDRTGLIDTLKKGGSIKSQTDKSPVKKTEVVGAGPAGFEWMVDMTEKPSYEEWVKDVNPDYMSDNYDLKKAFEVLPFGELQRWKKVIGTPLENQLPVETWHLPSVWFDRDNDVGVFLKKGQTAEENPELQYEFDAYNSNPEMQKEWKMVYDPEEGRWMYVRR